MSITLRDVGALVNLPPLGDTISPAILIFSTAPKFDKRYTDSYSGMQEHYNNFGSEPTHAERVAFLQLGFGQTWPIPPCYSKSFQERFHTITKVEAQTIDVRNASLMTGFYLAHFNPTTIVYPLFEQFWTSVKRRIFATNVNHAFHLLEGSRSSRTCISSIPAPIPAVPISIRRPTPSSSPSKSPPIRTRRSATGSLQFSSSPTQTGVIIGISSHKRPALGSSDWPDDNSDDNDDTHPLIRRKDANAILRSIQDLFTSREQVKASHAVRSSSANRPSTASVAFSIENINIFNLTEISSDVMVEDSLMMSLAAQMKEIQAKMDDCKARLVAKKRNASQEVERARSLLERYSNLEVDEGIMDELSTASIDQCDEWKKLRE
ncbi:hypothetical protein Adt_04735 [Abeliophyllum distichum]|uniref:Uncharacterized protein n=1 Tax=Abeliophyllum distichum TaxID=126358 RepID=A0ABD1V242_9LAMI